MIYYYRSIRPIKKFKNTYYNNRFEELNQSERASIFHAIFENKIKENMVMSSKVLFDFKMNPIIKQPKKMFQEVVSRGILQIQRGGFYHIPIPSLRTCMLEEYQYYLKIVNEKPSLKIQQLIASIQTPKKIKSNCQKAIE